MPSYQQLIRSWGKGGQASGKPETSSKEMGVGAGPEVRRKHTEGPDSLPGSGHQKYPETQKAPVSPKPHLSRGPSQHGGMRQDAQDTDKSQRRLLVQNPEKGEADKEREQAARRRGPGRTVQSQGPVSA